MSVILFAPVISQMPIGIVADLYDRAKTSALISVLAAIGAVMLALEVPSSFLAITATAAIVTGLSQPLYALVYGRLVDGGYPLIAATAAVLMSYNIGTFLGPFGAAFTMRYVGPAGLYAWAGLCLIVGISVALMATLRVRSRCFPN